MMYAQLVSSIQLAYSWSTFTDVAMRDGHVGGKDGHRDSSGQGKLDRTNV